MNERVVVTNGWAVEHGVALEVAAGRVMGMSHGARKQKKMQLNRVTLIASAAVIC
jgi:hypothetical protein